MNSKKTYGKRIKEVPDKPVIIKISNEIHNTNAHSLLGSDYFYDEITKQNNLETIVIDILDEDPIIFNMVLLYLKYAEYFPPKEHEESVLSLLNKYGIYQKFKNTTLFGFSKYLFDTVQYSNINDLFFSLTSESYTVLKEIYMQGVDINYQVENLYTNLINASYQCSPDFLLILFKCGRVDFLDNILNLLYLGCEFGTVSLIDTILEICTKTKLQINYVKMFDAICSAKNLTSLKYFLSCVVIEDKLQIKIINDKIKEQIISLSISLLLVKVEKSVVTLKVDGVKFTVDKDILDEMSKIDLEDISPKTFEVIYNYIKYPKYIIPRDLKDVVEPLLKKYNIKIKEFDDIPLTPRAKYLIMDNNGNINKAFKFASEFDYDTMHSIYMQGVDINFDVNDISNMWNYTITAHRQCNPCFINYMMERGRKDFDKHLIKIFTCWACCYSSIECLEEFCTIIGDTLTDEDILSCLRSLINTSTNKILKYMLSYDKFRSSLLDNIEYFINLCIEVNCRADKIFTIMGLSNYVVTKNILLKAIKESFYGTMYCYVANYLYNGAEPFELDDKTVEEIIANTSDRITKLETLNNLGFIIKDLDSIIDKSKNNTLPKPFCSMHCLVQDMSFFN